MKITLFAILVFSSLSAVAQVTHVNVENDNKPLTDIIKTIEDRLISKIKTLQSENNKLKSEMEYLRKDLSFSIKRIDSLRSITQGNAYAILQTKNQLGIQIKETGDKNENKITNVSNSLSQNSLYGIIGVLAAILISGLLYWLLSKRQKNNNTDFINQLSKTKSSIEQSLVVELSKQTELMGSQLHLIEQQNSASLKSPDVVPDHSLALKVASEINLIERNINLMDSKTRGLKQLLASVGKLKDNLSANGYEMPELIGKRFDQGMKVIVSSSIPDETLERGSEIITKILIPQVNYNNKMIQTAQIEVSVG